MTHVIDPEIEMENIEGAQAEGAEAEAQDEAAPAAEKAPRARKDPAVYFTKSIWSIIGEHPALEGLFEADVPPGWKRVRVPAERRDAIVELLRTFSGHRDARLRRTAERVALQLNPECDFPPAPAQTTATVERRPRAKKVKPTAEGEAAAQAEEVGVDEALADAAQGLADLSGEEVEVVDNTDKRRRKNHK
jgi:hypothetical protein